MDVVRELSCRYIAPVVQPIGLELDSDTAFRKWTVKHDLCCIVGATGDKYRYTAMVGFFSPFILRCYGLSDTELPTFGMCQLCGILVRIGDLLSMKLQAGWVITNEAELRGVGSLFETTLASQFPKLYDRFMTIDGWISHFKEKLVIKTSGRGKSWSLLGYCLLARDTTSFEEIQEIVEAHSRERPEHQNRIDMHLENQRSMVLERFGREV